MNHAIVRNVSLFSGLVLCSAACLAAAQFMISPRGSIGPSAMHASSPVIAILALAVSVGLAAAIAGIVGRLVNTVVGVFVLGAGLFVLASRLASAVDFAFGAEHSSSKSVLLALAFECLIWSAIALGGVLLVFAIAGPLRDVEPDENGERPHWLLSPQAVKIAAAGVLMLPIVWLIAKSPMRGQTLGATFFGGMAAGLAGRLIMPHVQPIVLFVSPIVFGALAYVATAMFLGLPMDAAFVMQKLPTIARVMPVDYAAGSLMGVAVGIGWAKSFLHHHEEQPAGPTTGST